MRPVLDRLNHMDKQQPVLSSRNQARITPGAVVCSECELCGEVVIGAGTIVHPKARIVAEAGPIHIGAFNLIEEQVEIINRTPDTVLKIGDHNVFEVGARCEAMEIGDNNVFEAKSFVGPHMRITNGCVIGAMCSLMSDETLPECTVIYGEQVSFCYCCYVHATLIQIPDLLSSQLVYINTHWDEAK
ncbi:hypothetical protein CRM22_007783 [Opisthorchis felineus]|uniref:Dynactin subunit 6 n=1 Tax=Opisthorchis felineus TaxID=147828 RepID=A0A4S2LE93_OPIFE|nr:hypothetical protein CRM22_007783 [Opisthorchis felineus]